MNDRALQKTTTFHTSEAANRDVDAGVRSFSIRDLCDAFDVTPRALRFYESQGLITPERDGQRRIYSLRDRARLFLVLRGKRFGFSLAEIRDLLELYEVGDRQYTQLAATLGAARDKLEQLETRRRELDDAVDELKSIIDGLDVAKVELEKDLGKEEIAAVEEAAARRKKPLLGEFPPRNRN